MAEGPELIVYEQRLFLYADILGWSKLVQRSEFDPEARRTVSETVDRLKREEYFQNLPGTACQMAFGSDSIFLSMSLDDMTGWTTSLLLLCNRFNRLLADHMLYVRGAILLGAVFHQRTTIVGPAVVSAVDLEKQTLYPRIVVHESALEPLRAAYQERDESQWLYRGPDGVACLNTIDIGFDSHEAGVLDLAAKTIDRIDEQVRSDAKDPKLVAKHLWMRTYCQYLLRDNQAAIG